MASDLFDVSAADLVGASLADVAGEQWLGVGGPDVALRSLDETGTWSGYAVHDTVAGRLPVALMARRLADRRSEDPAILLTVTVDADRVPSGWVGAVRADVAVLLGSAWFPSLLSLVGWLLTARDAEEIGAAVCGTVMEQMGAVGGHLTLVGGDNTASFVTIVGYSEVSRQRWPAVDLTVDTPIRRAIVEAAPVFVPDRDARDEQFPVLRGIEEPTQALCVVPVVLGGRVAGALGFLVPRHPHLPGRGPRVPGDRRPRRRARIAAHRPVRPAAPRCGGDRDQRRVHVARRDRLRRRPRRGPVCRRSAPSSRGPHAPGARASS